ncbi:hypothetical protein QOT17_019264 [Balamuthia mandrillaris]
MGVLRWRGGVWLLVTLFCIAPIGTKAQETPAGLLDPQNPGGQCTHISAFTEEELLGCDKVLDYEWIYTDNYTSVRLNRLIGGTSFFQVADKTCQEDMRCEEVELPSTEEESEAPVTTTMAVFTCWHLCDRARSSCLSALEGTGFDPSAVLACERPYFELSSGIPKYNILPVGPNYTVPISADGGITYYNVTMPCTDANITAPPGLAFTCPEGLHREGSFCAFDCPQPLVTDEEYHSLTLVITIFGWLSFVCLLWLIISYLITPSKRRYPAVLPIFFFGALLGRSFAFCLGSMVGHEEVWCSDDSTPNDWGDPWCTIQGIFFVFFTLAGAGWWFIISLQLFFSVVVGKTLHSAKHVELFGKKWEVSWFVGFHLCCWVLPLIPLIIALAAQRLGFGNDLWCTIHSAENLRFETSPDGPQHKTDEEAEANIWNLLLMTVPIFVLVFFGTILLSIVVATAYKQSKQGWRFFASQWRLIAFLLLYVWIYTFVLSFQIHFGVAKEDQYIEYSRYIKCSYQALADEIVGLPVTECELNSEVSYPLWMVATFSEVAQGFFVFFIFGTSLDLYRAWLFLIQNRRLLPSSSSSAVGTGKENHNDSGHSTSLRKVQGHRLTGKDEDEDEDDEDSKD